MSDTADGEERRWSQPEPGIFRQTVTELYTELNVTIITNNNQTLKHQLFLRVSNS